MSAIDQTRPTLRIIFAFLSGFMACLAILEIGIATHSDLLGQIGFFGAGASGGTGLGYLIRGRDGMVWGFVLTGIIGILIALANPASS